MASNITKTKNYNHKFHKDNSKFDLGFSDDTILHGLDHERKSVNGKLWSFVCYTKRYPTSRTFIVKKYFAAQHCI